LQALNQYSFFVSILYAIKGLLSDLLKQWVIYNYKKLQKSGCQEIASVVKADYKDAKTGRQMAGSRDGVRLPEHLATRKAVFVDGDKP
jgi:hypothetical protein|tara:strand:+ start:267 stop:530 length:264 start_codon:yes stop_codon:yes gene_type:complete